MTQKRGRISGAELTVQRAVSLGQRPDAPACLNDRAADEWFRIGNRMPSDWFTDETLSALQAHCEHVSEGEALQLMIEKVRKQAMRDDEAFKRYRELVKLKREQTAIVLASGTKMRLLQQSTYTTKAGATAKSGSTGGSKPWES